MSNALPEQRHNPRAQVARQSDNASLGAEDIRLPRVKFGQHLSRVVTDELVSYGAIYKVDSGEDMEPVVLASAAAAKGGLSDPVRFYVLTTPRKGWSWTDPNGDLSSSATYPDLELVKGGDPFYVRRTYDYAIALPEHPELPAMFLLHGKWGGQAAKQMNTRLVLAQQKGIDPATIAFKVQAKKDESDRGPFARAIIAVDDVPAKDRAADQAVVEELRGLVGGAPGAPAAPAAPAADTPDIG